MVRDIVYLILLLSVSVLGCIRYKRLDLSFRLLSFYCLYTFLSESISLILAYYIHNNSTVEKLYFPIEVIFLSFIYYILFESKRLKLVIIVLSSFLLVAAALLYYFYPQPLLPSYLVTAESAVLMAYSILYFLQLISDPVESRLLALGEFWLNSSILIYSTGSFVFWLTFYYLYHHKIFVPTLQIILFVLNILEGVMIAVSIYLNSKTKKHTFSNNNERF